MAADQIFAVLIVPALMVVITVGITLFRRRRRHSGPNDTTTVARTPLFLQVVGWVCGILGLLLALMGLSLQGSDFDDAIPMMISGAVLAVIGIALIERTGSVLRFEKDALSYKKPFRRGTIPYASIHEITTVTTQRGTISARTITVKTLDGRRKRFTISFHDVDWTPLREWAQAYGRTDLLE